jgi:hypothetical protein
MLGPPRLFLSRPGLLTKFLPSRQRHGASSILTTNSLTITTSFALGTAKTPISASSSPTTLRTLRFTEEEQLDRRNFTMNIGFTGTRLGMTKGQLAELERLLTIATKLYPGETYFHHGDCVGADEQAHDLVAEKFPQIKIVIHPPDDDRSRAFCMTSHIVNIPQPYLIRNTNIVLNSEILLAAVKKNEEELRSGTWYIIRKAKALKIPVTIIER